MVEGCGKTLSKQEYLDEVIIPKMETIKGDIRDLFKSIVYLYNGYDIFKWKHNMKFINKILSMRDKLTNIVEKIFTKLCKLIDADIDND